MWVDKSPAEAQRVEKISLQHVQELLHRVEEVLGLWRVLLDHQFHTLTAALSQDQQNQLRSLTFKTLVLSGTDVSCWQIHSLTRKTLVWQIHSLTCKTLVLSSTYVSCWQIHLVTFKTLVLNGTNVSCWQILFNHLQDLGPQWHQCKLMTDSLDYHQDLSP